MADQEVIKHTKKIFSIWGIGNKGFWNKLKEFIVEILIIVFAVTCSIYLHDRSEKKHQQHEAKEFLLGLKLDLQTDTAEMNEDRASFVQSGRAFNYITSIKRNEPLHSDSVNKYARWIFNTTGLIPNSGRFEGFKSSGRISTIENRDLQNNIMDLYQENIPGLIVNTNDYTFRKQKLFEYLGSARKRITDSTTNLLTVLATDQSFNICSSLRFVEEIIKRYDTCLNKMKIIMKQIDKEYK